VVKLSIPKAKQKDLPAGYFDEVLANGQVDGDFVHIAPATLAAIRQKYGRKGFGDLVATIAKPVARVIDKATGSKLENCIPCAQRQADLNGGA